MKRVFEAGRISRTQIALDTGLTAAAISRITRELLDLKLLEEGSLVSEKGRPGRRSVELSLRSDGAYVVGIGAGAFEQRLQLATLHGKVIARRSLRLVGLNTVSAGAAIVDAIKTLLQQNDLKSATLVGCGAAIAGVVDKSGEEIVSSPNFGWKNFPLAKILHHELGLQTAVESLHHALNLTESKLGHTAGVDNVLLVNAALGIGASILADGKIFRGGSRAAGQLGHIPVDGVTEICTCGRRGCLDTVASGHAVLTRLGLIPPRERPHEHEPSDSKLLKRAMEQALTGDSIACDAFKSAGASLGKALGSVRMITDPERIILAGPLAQVPSYVEGTREALINSRTMEEPLPALVISDQQNDAAGAWVALDRFVFTDRLDPATFKIV